MIRLGSDLESIGTSPCRTSNFPENRDAVAMSCNYLMGDQLGVGAPSFLADVDAYAKSASYWGTLQQGRQCVGMD